MLTVSQIDPLGTSWSLQLNIGSELALKIASPHPFKGLDLALRS